MIGRKTYKGKRKTMPQISIIVPVYNSEKYLGRCIDSLLAQSFKDFELILINDCSQDRSAEICEAYAEKDTRIKVINKLKNEGVSAARNSGIDIAEGKYLMFCDSDDYVSPKWCQLLYDAILSNGKAWIVSNIWCVSSKGKTLQTTQKKESLTDYFMVYKSGISAYIWNKIYDLDIIRRAAIRFDKGCYMGEDVIFNIEYYKHCDSIIFLEEPLYYYCENINGAMKRYYVNFFSLHLPLFAKRCPLIRADELTEYCDIWFYQFWQLFENIFNPRNKMTFLEKLQYNQKMMNSTEFKYCVEHSSQLNQNGIFPRVLKTYNYYLVYLFGKIVSIKKAISKIFEN